MKGRVILLDQLQGRAAAALMVDGHLADICVDPPEDAGPMPGAIFRAVADRPMKGQGGVTVSMGAAKGFLKQAGGISPGDRLLVQVTGPAEPGKAAPVTTRLLFKSRYAIVTPDAPGLNISRRIRDEAERDRLLEIAHAAMEGAPEGHGLILRSAAEAVDPDALEDDITAMRDLAAAVVADTDGPPECLVDAPDAHLRAWRDWADPDPDEVVDTPGCFETHGVIDAVEAALAPLVDLPGGGTAYVEPTRALVAVDVNTGADTSLDAQEGPPRERGCLAPRLPRGRGRGGSGRLDAAGLFRTAKETRPPPARHALARPRLIATLGRGARVTAHHSSHLHPLG